MKQNREAELSPLVSAWLRSLGCSVYSEISGHISGVIDHVGIRWSDEMIVAVEMKTSLTWKVIYQAMMAQLITQNSWVAVATKPRRSSLDSASKHGIGVWANGCVLLHPSAADCHVVEQYRQRVLDKCRNRPEGGIGGLPTLAGDGPRIRTVAAIRQYLEEHPTASWREIYRDVPNHYAHYRSLQGAMPPREYFFRGEAT